MHMNQQGFINIIFVVVVAVLVAVAGYFAFVKKSEPVTERETLTHTQTTTPTETAIRNSNSVPTQTSAPKLAKNITFQKIGRGCNNFFVYKISEISNDIPLGIAVSAQRAELGLSTKEKTFDVGKTSGLSVMIYMGESRFGTVAGAFSGYCANFPINSGFKTLVGQGGTATISISNIVQSKIRPSVWNEEYTVTVVLKNVHFVDDSGNDSDIIVDKLIFENIRVGGGAPF